MPDDTTNEPDEKKDDKPIEPPAPPPSGEHASLAALERYKAEIMREFEQQKTLDAQERQEFREALKQVNEWIADQKKAQEEREKSHDTKGTIVVPPSQVAEGLNPPQEGKPANDEDAHHAEERKRRSILHGWY